MSVLITKWITWLAQNSKLTEFVTGNTLFCLSALVLTAICCWVIMMRTKNHRM